MSKQLSTQTPVHISITTGTVIRTIAILAGLWVLWMIQDIVLYVFIALLVAGLMYPMAHWAKAHRIPRGLAVVVSYILLLGVFGLVIALLVPAVLSEVKNLASTEGGIWQWFHQAAGSTQLFLIKYGIGGSLQELFQGWGHIQFTATKLVDVLIGIFGGIAGFLTVLVLSFYVIVEENAVRNLFRHAIPKDYQDMVGQVIWQVIEKLGGWLRGQIVLGAIIGILYFIGLSIIGVPYALLLALFGALTEFIPYVGPFISGIPVVIFAFTDSPWKALAAGILIVIIQQLENNVIVPKVMQKAVGINPVLSIVAFLIGAEKFGVVGAIFAIPVAVAATVAISEVMKFRRDRV
ncbi:MAG: AI-2E family transporter [bacterium]|nr:AI-2E family transporter [bacterium]